MTNTEVEVLRACDDGERLLGRIKRPPINHTTVLSFTRLNRKPSESSWLGRSPPDQSRLAASVCVEVDSSPVLAAQGKSCHDDFHHPRPMLSLTAAHPGLKQILEPDEQSVKATKSYSLVIL